MVPIPLFFPKLLSEFILKIRVSTVVENAIKLPRGWMQAHIIPLSDLYSEKNLYWWLLKSNYQISTENAFFTTIKLVTSDTDIKLSI